MEETIGRQNFDMVALMSLLKDMQPNQMALVISQLQAGNREVINALQCYDKSGLLTALGIEKSIGEAKNDLQRDITNGTQVVGALLQGLGNKMDCGFREVAKELCDIRLEAVRSAHETQLRDMENMHKLAMLERDGQDATYNENHKTRSLIRSQKVDELRDKVSDLECKVNQFENQKFVREAVCDELLIHGRGRRDWDDCDFHHGRRGHHGCDDDFEFRTRRGCGNVEVNINERRRGRRDDDGHGNGHGND